MKIVWIRKKFSKEKAKEELTWSTVAGERYENEELNKRNWQKLIRINYD